MIIGGWVEGIGRTASVLKFDSSNLNDDPVEVESMVHGRHYHACTTFKSGLHDGRTIMIVAGGYDGTGRSDKTIYYSAEIWDFTQEGTSWEKSNLTFAFISPFYVFHKEGVIILSDFFPSKN